MCDYCESRSCANCTTDKGSSNCLHCEQRDEWTFKWKYCPECGRPVNAMHTPEDIAEHVESVLAGCNTYILSSIDGEGKHVGRFRGVSVDANGSLVISADIDKVSCTSKSTTVLESLQGVDSKPSGYIEDNVEIEEASIQDATTIGTYANDDLQTIEFKYDKPNSVYAGTLFNARPSCHHKIQAQWSGIKCIACGGWYCA